VLVKNIGACAESIEEKSTMLKQTSAKEFNPKNICFIKLPVDNDIKLKKDQLLIRKTSAVNNLHLYQREDRVYR